MTVQSEVPIDAPAYRPVPFWIAVQTDRDAIRIAPRGELDLATVGQLQRDLARLIGTGPARIVIDLRGVEFLDCRGLHTLLDAADQAQREHWELAIVPGPRAVQRIFELTCTIDRLPFTANSLPQSRRAV